MTNRCLAAAGGEAAMANHAILQQARNPRAGDEMAATRFWPVLAAAGMLAFLADASAELSAQAVDIDADDIGLEPHVDPARPAEGHAWRDRDAG